MAQVGDVLGALERNIAGIELEVPLFDRERDAGKIGEYWNDLVKANENLRQAKRKSRSCSEQWRIYRIRQRVERVLDQLDDIRNPLHPFSFILSALLCWLRCCRG